jgi:hypothetical protein
MNRFLLKLMCMLLLTIGGIAQTFAQKGSGANKGVPQTIQRCATDEAMLRQYQTDPVYRAMVDQREREYQAWKTQNSGQLNDMYRTTLLTGPVTIPVVVHVVLANPNVITDQDVDYFINRLNLDFSGLNPDSTNATAWYSVRGHSLLRFGLAKRTPTGQPTSGIERRVSTTQSNGSATNDPIKSTAAGGLDSWDNTQYYNVWTGVGQGGILGYSNSIGPGVTSQDGVFIASSAFANNPCHDQAPYNLARTVTHEIGHNFGLYHTFQGGCADADNGNMTGSCSYPASILALPDQTPAASNSFFGCPAPNSVVAPGCATAPNPPGKQYQNFMDYTDDACMTMFTQTQVSRMHYVLEFCRPGYLTSLALTPPASMPANDGALVNFVSPGGSEATNTVGNCLINYPLPTCPGSVTPRVMIANFGSSAITSVTISFTSGAGTTTNTYTTNIPSLRRGVVVLNNVNAVVGANTYTATITQINGSADAVSTNNTGTVSFTVVAPTTLPRFSDFVTTTFPPAGFTISNPNNNNTWVRNANGNSNVGSAFIDFYNFNNVGQIDEIRTTPATYTVASATDSVIATFDLAHKNFPNFNDRLEVLYSIDCGATWVSLFNRSGATLATAGSSTANYTTPAAADWRNQRLAVGGTMLSGGVIQFAFKATNGYGNNIFIDNININVPVNRDAAVSSILTPNAAECSPTFTPRVEIRNAGIQTINSFDVVYNIDGGANSTPVVVNTPLAPGATTIVTLPVAVTTVGTHVINATVGTVTGPSGVGDQSPSNDVLSKNFTVRALSIAPLVEGFESLPFPSTGWAISNPQPATTWVRRTNAGGYALSNSSMFIDNYNFNVVGNVDALITPPVSIAGADSVAVTFDLAHKNFAGFNDSLIVFVSKDCGASFQRAGYAKGGAGLATAGASTANYTAPIASDWRTEKVTIGGALISGSNSVLIAIANRNGYGNNVFVDNINIGLIYRRDIAAVTTVRPSDIECSGNFTPSLTVRNAGLDVVNSFTATYRIDGGAAVNTNITGLTLAAGASANYNLTPVTGLAVGSHTLIVYTSALVTNAGTGDQNMLNDTFRRTFTVLPVVSAPISQDFQGATFPPANYGVVNTDAGVTWSSANVGFNSSKSTMINNFGYSAAGSNTRNDDFVTPNVTYSGVDSVFLSFDLAAKTRVYPGSTVVKQDTLSVLLTKDCGVTYTTLYKAWGEDLQTVNDPNYSTQFAFVPTDNSQWKNVKLNITNQAGLSSTGFVVIFRNSSNNDNNIYLDNINLNTVTVPAVLKARGYAISPSPFSSSFNVLHYLAPTDLRYVEVFDARGRLVYRKQYNNGASSNENVDISREASGVYTVKLGYTNKVISERIIKTN